MSSNESISTLKTVEVLSQAAPGYSELIDMWANYLEFWDRDGGLDNVAPEEIERAHAAVIARASEILSDYPGDQQILGAHSNLALHTAQQIRQTSIGATVEDIK